MVLVRSSLSAAFVVLSLGILMPGSAYAVCSVYDDNPCTPYSCGVYDGPDCIPEIFYPPGQDLRLTVQSRDREHGASPQAPVNTIRELFAALSACWSPPPIELSRPGMEITVRLSFKRDGNILGKPHITYETKGISADERLAYRNALAESLQRCTPLPLSEGLGGALAGRPINIRFVDDRKLKRAEQDS
jgi:hypothetical protein